MNSLDRKIDSMIVGEERYADLQIAVCNLLQVMSRAHVISFLKYAESMKGSK
jgi:hypothetical protein